MTSPIPPRPHHPGDGWVEGANGARYWGLFGAAGLLAYDPDRGVLLQHRVEWSHFGGTWALPGGALCDALETPVDGAIREAQEEAGVPTGAISPRAAHVFDVGVWRYTTVVADVVDPFEPVISDPESLELRWVPVDEVDQYPLHPGFALTWPEVRAALEVRPVVLVDAANVVGSTPDGWWKDRAGATERLLARLAALSDVPASDLDLGLDMWQPVFAAVVEGQARDADAGPLSLFRAEGSGDDEIVRRAEELLADGSRVFVVTSDRELRDRVEALGAHVRGSSWLRDRLPTAEAIAPALAASSWMGVGLTGFFGKR
ncbi:NUDIX domain-containing protein [Microbacterium gubbeenense]|uniref:NUDIX domain-containing protein n=2 Tax=Microbacterium gubbeenense TaxID=159896 RepID=UPI003F94C2D0